MGDKGNIKYKLKAIQGGIPDIPDILKFSISYSAPKGIDAARRIACNFISKLGAGLDAIMEINSGYSEKAASNRSESILSVQEYASEFTRLNVEYKQKKVPAVNAALLGRLFTGRSRKEDDVIIAYIDNEMINNDSFIQALPYFGVMFHFTERQVLLGEDDNRLSAINRFLDMTDTDKLTVFERAVFCYAYFGQIGVSTRKTGYDELKCLLDSK